MIILRLFGVHADVGVGDFTFVFPLPDPARILAFACFTRHSTFTIFETVSGLSLLRDFVW
jgi:hypothetical protein